MHVRTHHMNDMHMYMYTHMPRDMHIDTCHCYATPTFRSSFSSLSGNDMTSLPTMGAQSPSVNTFLMNGSFSPCWTTMLAIWITRSLSASETKHKHHLTTVRPALVTTCIQRPPLFKDHLVMSQLWLYHALLPLLRDHLYLKTTFFFGPSVVT